MRTNKSEQKKPTLSIKIRSTIMWLLLCSTMPLYNLLAFITLFLPIRLRHRIIITWGGIFLFLTKHICKTKYQVFGQENLLKGPVIFACNHQSTWETLALNSFLPPHVWIIKQELLKIPFFGWALRMVAPIAINRKNPTAASKQILLQSAQRIKHGFGILVYPEGTRVSPHVKNHPYKTGTARMALELKLPIIPIAHNAGYIMPRRSFWVYPGLVTVQICAPIYIHDNDNAESLTAKIKAEITRELEKIDKSS